MLRRARLLAACHDGVLNAGARGRKRKLSLRDSSLMRLAAAQVGRGASASTFGDVARAASDEAGAHNLSSGACLYAAMCN